MIIAAAGIYIGYSAYLERSISLPAEYPLALEYNETSGTLTCYPTDDWTVESVVPYLGYLAVNTNETEISCDVLDVPEGGWDKLIFYCTAPNGTPYTVTRKSGLMCRFSGRRTKSA